MQFYLSLCYKSLLFVHLKLKAFFCKNYKTEHFQLTTHITKKKSYNHDFGKINAATRS